MGQIGWMISSRRSTTSYEESDLYPADSYIPNKPGLDGKQSYAESTFEPHEERGPLFPTSKYLDPLSCG
jgi:hypothetical protein